MRESTGLNHTLDIDFTVVGKRHVEACMPITEAILQPFGFVHGGATLALLEAVASAGANECRDVETELPFGVEVDVRHRKSGRAGTVRGVADFDHEEPSRGRVGGVKQYWNVRAFDDAGDVMSEGVMVIKIVSKERLAQVRQQEGANEPR